MIAMHFGTHRINATNDRIDEVLVMLWPFVHLMHKHWFLTLVALHK